MKFFTSTRIAPGNLNVSRTLGDIETKLKKYGGLPGMISAEPDIKTFDKENYDILLLASDGLFEAFTNLEVQKMYYRIAQSEVKNKISSSELAKKFLDKLIAEALEKSTDNITIIVVPLV
jgi:protein phosphatase 2C family protein 2/3